MRKLGLLGGMSWESSLIYYKGINEAIRDSHKGSLTSADLILYSFNFQDIVDLQKANEWAIAEKRLSEAASGLTSLGAEAIIICTNTMHLVAPQISDRLSVPLIHIIDETAKAILAQGFKNPLLLATSYTMEHGFYTDHMAQLGLNIILPSVEDRQLVHSIIFEELCLGQIKPSSRRHLQVMIAEAKKKGADCVILGCTEIGLILNNDTCPLACFDSTHIHIKAAVDFMLGQTTSAQEALSSSAA